MEKIKQLSRVFETMPLAAQIFIGAFLLAFAIASVYSRISPAFAAKTFSEVPFETLQSDKKHIAVYTGIPVLLAVFFFGLLAVYYLS